MLKTRIIPLLTFNGFALVKTKNFTNPRMIGNPVQSARVFNSRNVDELAFIDIYATKQNRKINLNLVKDVINQCFMPVSIGGGIKSLDDINDLLKIGADKVIIKSASLLNEKFISDAVNFFGSQCISLSIDCKKKGDEYFVFNDYLSDLKLRSFIDKVNNFNVGEIVLNSVDNDGLMSGFDHSLTKYVIENTEIPIIAAGGGGVPAHFSNLVKDTGVGALGASSIYYYTQFTPDDIKRELKNNNIPVRIL